MGITLLQIVTLGVVFELLFIGRGFQNDERLRSFSWIVAVFGVNYGLLLFYNLAIYPIFVDPLRNVPGPKVHLPPAYCVSLSTDPLSTEICWHSRYGTIML